MSKKPISPLRQRMIDDMTARRVKEKVQKDYVRHVRTFAAFLGRSPNAATSEDLRRFQVHLARQEIGVATINAAIAALRFFFNVTLERPDLVLARRSGAASRADPSADRLLPPKAAGMSCYSVAEKIVSGRADCMVERRGFKLMAIAA